MEYNNIDKIMQEIKENPLTILMISTRTCGVCIVIKSKLKEVLKSYNNVKMIYTYMDELPMVSGKFNVFTVPAVILFAGGKEVHREVRFVDVEHMEFEIGRWSKYM